MEKVDGAFGGSSTYQAAYIQPTNLTRTLPCKPKQTRIEHQPGLYTYAMSVFNSVCTLFNTCSTTYRDDMISRPAARVQPFKPKATYQARCMYQCYS